MNRISYAIELQSIIESIPAANRQNFLNAFLPQEKNPVVLYGFNIWLGGLGIDRFVVGDILAGILKLITLGGFGIWVLVDCFLIGGRARDRNIAAARAMRAGFMTPPAEAAPAQPAHPAPDAGAPV